MRGNTLKDKSALHIDVHFSLPFLIQESSDSLPCSLPRHLSYHFHHVAPFNIARAELSGRSKAGVRLQAILGNY